MIRSNPQVPPYGQLSSDREPIAIVGLGCRFPGGANSWQAYWQLLLDGRDAIQQTPASRWNLNKFYAPEVRPGKTQSRWGGYVDGIDQFDPQLFGISPREAASMDPQQRMLLEVAFRAIEDGGQPLGRLAARPVSVFVGISSFDYAVAGLSARDRGVIDAYSNTGGSSSIAANRISYCFDLRGPSVAVDTACSSSLVAVHMACESLWRGEAEMALAGGVNALILPDFYVAFSQLGVLSPDGRCRTFDASANGYVRSEGAGMVLLKPLSAARRDRDPIYAVIRSTALNQDGRTPGMTVPSQQAQQALLQLACEKAGIAPHEIDYVEAHGTGTPVGDPIEAAAIGSAVACDRGSRPACWVGSVKTNIGHLEAGAGIASLIKVALSLRHQQIPRHLHFQAAHPDIDFQALRLRVPTATTPWERTSDGHVRLAGINGFGYGGANAHVILEQPPELIEQLFHGNGGGSGNGSSNGHAAAKNQAATNNTLHPNGQGSGSEKSASDALPAPALVPLSARSHQALQQMALDVASWLESDAGKHAPLGEVASYLAHRRSHFEQRLAVVAASRSELVSELRSAVERAVEAESEDRATRSHGLAFVCCGQGPQWWGMGRGLLKYSPVFRETIKRCDAEFRKHVDWSLLEELSRAEDQSRMQRTSIAQPALFAIQVALAAVWESWGVRPDTIVGHSVGEIAASYLAGALSWEDACCVAIHRGRTMDLATSQGAMLAVGISAEEAQQWLVGRESLVSLAANNGPSSVTLSGDKQAIAELESHFQSNGVFCRGLAVEYAFHSPQMEPVREELLQSLVGLSPRTPHTTMISTVTGGRVTAGELDADYWWRNVRLGVRFCDALGQIAMAGVDTIIELGPHPVLAYSISECFQAAGRSVRSTASLNRKQDDLVSMTRSLGQLYSWGVDIDWQGFYTRPLRQLSLPGYPFQQQRCWSESLESFTARLAEPEHPLLGEQIVAPELRWQQRIDLKLQDYLADHRVRGTAVYPAAAIVETALAAARANCDEGPLRLKRLRLHAPCVLTEERPQWIETVRHDDRGELKLFQRECADDQWQPLATVELSREPITVPADEATESLRQAVQRCTRLFTADEMYRYCEALGLQYGTQFRGVQRGRVIAGEAVVDVALPTRSLGILPGEHSLGILPGDNYIVHPALLDSCFHAMVVADPNFDHVLDGLYLPAEIREIIAYRPVTENVTVHARLLSKTRRAMVCDLTIFDDRGELCLELRGFRSVRVHGGQEAETAADLQYSYVWSPSSATEDFVGRSSKESPALEVPALGRWLLFMDQTGVGERLAARLREDGGEVVEVYHAPVAASLQADRQRHVVDPEQRQQMTDTIRAVIDSVATTDEPLRGIVYLWGLDAQQSDPRVSVERLEQSTLLTTLAPLYLVQAFEEHVDAPSVDLTLVTAGAQAEDDTLCLVDVGQAPLIGFGRVIISEAARLRARLIDLPQLDAPQLGSARDIAATVIDVLAAELSSPDDEDEILWRGGRRYARRFQPQRDRGLPADVASVVPCRLRVGASAGIEELNYRTRVDQPPLAAGEVEIEVLAAGLNFSDVMKALDLYPGLPDGVVDLGAECSGRIVRVGVDVEFKIGDEVIAVATGSFGTHVVVHQYLVARKPVGLTHEQAAALPIAFLTADYALNECARLRAGESVLIHAASGGVGLAAIQIARNLGATVLATAGTDEKRQFVLAAGASHAMDSRSLAFGDETMRWTGGAGVDAVLNSLPGEAIRTGLSVLKTGGRFLEIGKRDIYADAALGLHPFRNNLSLFAIDLDQLFKVQPQRMGERLRSLVQQFDRGELRPLPVKAYPAKETAAAFRLMQQSKHIGKVVISYGAARPTHVLAGDSRQAAPREDGTYWIAGGLGGFGLQVASWLIERGAKHLVLSGRSQALRPEAQQAIDAWRAVGIRVVHMPADITRLSEVRRVVDQIDAELPPLRGVFHTAMVLQDKLLIDLDRTTLDAVLRPKMLGGWNLHQATLGRELDMFVLFSSLSSVFGHAGQANYSAANAFLDSLAHHRRAMGLAGLAINWGHLGEVGYLAEREQLGQRLERQGVLSFTVEQAMQCLDDALRYGWIQLSVLRMDWKRWRGLGVTNRVSPRFAHLLQHEASEIAGDELLSADRLRRLDASERERHVELMLRRKAASLLGIADSQLPLDRSLLELGLDSLMAVEMRNWLEGHLQINLPISALMSSGDLRSLVATISGLIDEQVTDRSVAIEAARPAINPAVDRVGGLSGKQASELLDQLPDMSADEVTRLLAEVLRDESR